MTRITGECCGNCDLFMVDRLDDFQGACAVLDDECTERGMYHLTTRDDDCAAWTPRKIQEREVRLIGGWTTKEVDA